MQRSHAPGAGGSLTFGPDADAEGLVLDLLNRQDRYVARRTCQAAQHGLGARTTTLVLCEDRVGGAEVLASVDLARSFPGVRTLVLRFYATASRGWQSRFCAFVARNLAALQQLHHLDLLGTDNYGDGFTTATLGSVAQLTGLRSLCVWADSNLQACSWSALRSLAQLTSLRVADAFRQKEGSHLQHIVAAAPQLQQLHYTIFCTLGTQDVSSIASLASLASLHLQLWAEGTPHLARALTALPGLTHLGLDLHVGFLGPQPQLMQALMQALGQLTGLSSLEVDGCAHHSLPLAPLKALQQLTHLSLDCGTLEAEDSTVLARLGALRTLQARFKGPAAVATAGLHRLQGVTALVHMGLEAEGPIAPIQLAGGCCLRVRGSGALHCFETSQVHVLELHDSYLDGAGSIAAAVCPVMRSSPQLQALQLRSTLVLDTQVLQAVAACSQLTSLHLDAIGKAAPAAEGLAALAQGRSRLRRLKLQDIKGLSADMLPALMRLPWLRLLRLLGCGEAVGQEQCQALVGRPGLRELQVDVVVADGSLRAGWMIEQFKEG
jgi:hypothetical protein